jgi:hypothetical protein
MCRVARWFLAIALSAGCAEHVELLPDVDLAGHLGGHDDMSVGPGNMTSGDMGSAITLPTTGGMTCAAAAAAPFHRFALCSCSPLSIDRNITSTVFDSTGAATNHTGAAFGCDGDFHETQPVQLEGAFYSSGIATFDSGLTTTETLRAGGGIGATQTASVTGDGYSGGDVSGSLIIGGTLHVTAAANVATSVQAGAIVREAVSIAPPCDCSGAAAIDVAGTINAAAQKNDNGGIGLATGALSGSVTLPAGTFYVASISGNDDLILTVNGPAALAVAGDVTLAKALIVQLGVGAELDVFIAGTLTTQSNRVVGSTTAPARVRIWTLSSSLQLGGTPVVGAVVTAPMATVSTPNGFELYGSLLAQSLAVGNDLVLHYDRAILSSGVACGEAALPPVK